ncbi:hypothetical protein [Aeromonas caviae]|uniref:hypothetical protein n=1 Tax=Aeromonas caviae TaxID=648 RepID=UPI0006717293|nr:hypothetical protein [Aeromonas caviae]KMY30063.1 hypothetical protein ACH48_14270 [Aeromonas caviae]
MELIDNINRLLGDDLKQTLRPGARLKIAATCFSMYAFEALKAEPGIQIISATLMDEWREVANC